MSSVREMENDIAQARESVRRDFEALGRELGRDERQAKARIHEYGPYIVAGAGGLGLLIGFGGMKWVKRLLILGAVGGAAAVFVKKQLS